MSYLHIAIIEDYEECLVSNTEDGLRAEVTTYLIAKSIAPPSDAEWLVCILSKVDDDIKSDNLFLGMITYYKTKGRLEMA